MKRCHVTRPCVALLLFVILATGCRSSPERFTAAPVPVTVAPAVVSAGMPAASLSGGTITLGEVRARILDKANLRLAAEEYRKAEARGMVQQAALPPNPFVMIRKRRISGLDVLDSGFTEVEVGQPIELGHKRRARVAEAQAEAATVSERVRALTLLTLHDSEAWFYRLLRLEQDLDVAREAESVAGELEGLARTRQEGGKDSRVPVLRFQAAAESARLAVQDVQRQHESACRKMDEFLGLPVGTTRGSRGAWETGKAEGFDRAAAHRTLTRHPRRLVAKREHVAAYRSVRRADADAWPNVTLGMMGERDFERDANFVGLSLYVPVPIWNRNEGNRFAARASVGRARRAIEAETLVLGVELDRAILLHERATHNVRGYEDRIIPTLDESVELARAAYEGGRGSYLDVLDALIAWIRARRERLGHLEEQAQAVVAIRYLTGML